MMSASRGLTANAPVCVSHFASSTHSVQFYEENSFLLDSLTKLIGTTFVEGKTAVIIITPANREGLETRLSARGFDLEALARLGKYCAFDAVETLASFMANDRLDIARVSSFAEYFLCSFRFNPKEKTPRLFLFGEMATLLWSKGNVEDALKLEQVWNDLSRIYSFNLHCAYPLKGFEQTGQSQTFLSLCAEHSHVVPTENYTALSTEEERLRHISLLELRALTAETEASGRRRAEEALHRSEKLATTGRLAATIAHEINNPLEAISNAIYLARSSPAAEVAQFLKIADEELARVAQITRQTLGFYREIATPGVVKISTLLDELLTLYSHKLEAKNLTIEKQYRDELEIWGLEGELRQVFANQLTNAIYATPQNGRLTIRIRRSKSWGNGQYPGTAITLIDTGSGISQEVLSKIFDPFFTTKQDVGNGLGLWITHDIITRHGGTIRARSNTRPGASGTIFTTFLPHHKANTQSAN